MLPLLQPQLVSEAWIDAMHLFTLERFWIPIWIEELDAQITGNASLGNTVSAAPNAEDLALHVVMGRRVAAVLSLDVQLISIRSTIYVPSLRLHIIVILLDLSS